MQFDPFANVPVLRQTVYARAGAMPQEIFPKARRTKDFRPCGRWLLLDLLSRGRVSDPTMTGADDLADLLVWPRTVWSAPGGCLFDLHQGTAAARLTYFGLLVYRMRRASGDDHEEALETIRADYGGYV